MYLLGGHHCLSCQRARHRRCNRLGKAIHTGCDRDCSAARTRNRTPESLCKIRDYRASDTTRSNARCVPFHESVESYVSPFGEWAPEPVPPPPMVIAGMPMFI